MFRKNVLKNLHHFGGTVFSIVRYVYIQWREFINARWWLYLAILFFIGFFIGVGLKIIAREHTVIGYDDYRIVADSAITR